jgi:hypothetical protein
MSKMLHEHFAFQNAHLSILVDKPSSTNTVANQRVFYESLELCRLW